MTPERRRALNAARDYLRFQLGGRRGCRVLEEISTESEREIVAECADAFEKFARTENSRLQSQPDVK